MENTTTTLVEKGTTMKIKKHNQQQLKQKIQLLKNLQGTPHQKRTDHRYLKAYQQQLNNLKKTKQT